MKERYLMTQSLLSSWTYWLSNGRDIYTEEYRRADCEPIENTIRSFLQFLHATNLQMIYFEKWRAKA